MNTAEIYNKALGREVEGKANKQELDPIIVQQKVDWINHPFTKLFFIELEQLYLRNIAQAENLAQSGENPNVPLIKAKTLKEVLSYGRRD